MFSRKSAKRGFTLIELMTSVAIAGILASLAIPTFARYKLKIMETEVLMQLPELANGLEAWYHTEHCAEGFDSTAFGAWGILAGYTPGTCVSHCITNWFAIPGPPGLADDLGSHTYTIDWTQTGGAHDAAREAGFTPVGPLRYWYVIFSSGAGFSDTDGDGDLDLDPLDDNCGNFDDHSYLLVAVGDIDDDDELAWHALGMETVDGQMVRSPVHFDWLNAFLETGLKEH